MVKVDVKFDASSEYKVNEWINRVGGVKIEKIRMNGKGRCEV